MNKALEILQNSDDGNKLDPGDLKLVEAAVNGWLSEAGEAAFYDLHQRVMSNTYVKPWLQGIEHLTRDHQGYVYWKGQEIDHWCGDLPYSERGKREAQMLRDRCLILEAAGKVIDTYSVIWNWPE